MFESGTLCYRTFGSRIGILSPQEFVEELFQDRFTNEYLGDTYMLAVNDAGNKYEPAPDPMNEEIQEQLKPILSNKRIFFVNMYETGLGERIETMFRDMIAGPGAVKATVHKYVGG